MTDDFEFIDSVRDLANNGTLVELLRRIEEEQTDLWKIARTSERREQCWHVIEGIQLLATKIKSFTEDEKVREWAVARRIKRSV